MAKGKDKFEPKEMSNPYSTGGVGSEFEKSVQASFVVLLLSGGIFPALSSYPIVKIELQNRIRGVYTDDLTVYTGKDSSEIYDKVASHFNVSPNNVVVFEDSLTAIKTAFKSNYNVVAVYDINSTKDIDKTTANSHLFIRNFQEFIDLYK